MLPRLRGAEMNENDFQLRAIVSKRDGGLEAQLLEIDIAARSQDVDGLLEEIAHAITVTFEIAKDLGNTPFVDILEAPPTFHNQWHDGQGTQQVGWIELAEPVAEALAAALRQRKPIRRIAVTIPKRIAA